MADIALNPQAITRAGLAPAYQGSLSITDTYTVNNDGRLFLHFKKSGAGACTVTIQTPGTVEGLGIADATVVVPATTGDVMVGPFPPALFNGSDYLMRVTLSEITGLTVAVVRV